MTEKELENFGDGICLGIGIGSILVAIIADRRYNKLYNRYFNTLEKMGIMSGVNSAFAAYLDGMIDANH